MSHPPAAPDFEYIDTDEALGRLARRIRSATRIGIDTEADSLHSYHEKVCLIQISLPDGFYLVDPLAAVDLAPLLDAFEHTYLVLHGADYDLRMMNMSFGFRAETGVFDTMLGAQLLGHEQFGLAALVQHYFGVELPKGSQKSDWSQRPLSERQLRYAVNDVVYLLDLAERVEEELEAKGRRPWHREACREVIETALTPNPRDPETAWRVKGAGRLERPALAVLREIWKWREAQAERADRPPFKILGNQAMLELATWAVEHHDAPLNQGPRLPRHCRGKRLETLERAIDRGRSLPERKHPPLRPPRKADTTPLPSFDPALVSKLREARNKVAEELELTPSLLAPRATLEALAAHRPTSQQAMCELTPMSRWQARVLGSALLPLLKRRGRPRDRGGKSGGGAARKKKTG